MCFVRGVGGEGKSAVVSKWPYSSWPTTFNV